MTTPQTLVVRTFTDRAEGLSHFVLRAGEAPRLLAFDDALGCPVETALAALEWTGAVGDSPGRRPAARGPADQRDRCRRHRAKESAGGRRYVYLGPRLDAPPMDVFEGAILFDEPGVKAVEFTQRAHGLAHFLRATVGVGALLALCWDDAPRRFVTCAGGWARSFRSSIYPGRWWPAGSRPARPAVSSPRPRASLPTATSKSAPNHDPPLATPPGHPLGDDACSPGYRRRP